MCNATACLAPTWPQKALLHIMPIAQSRSATYIHTTKKKREGPKMPFLLSMNKKWKIKKKHTRMRQQIRSRHFDLYKPQNSHTQHWTDNTGINNHFFHFLFFCSHFSFDTSGTFVQWYTTQFLDSISATQKQEPTLVCINCAYHCEYINKVKYQNKTRGQVNAILKARKKKCQNMCVPPWFALCALVT